MEILSTIHEASKAYMIKRSHRFLQEMVDEYSKFKGTLYNVEGGSKGTGVRYEDVAGVEHAMDVIKNTVEILVGGEEYRAMGAKPARVISPGPFYPPFFGGT